MPGEIMVVATWGVVRSAILESIATRIRSGSPQESRRQARKNGKVEDKEDEEQ